MGDIVLDLTSLACQPTTKSREQSGDPERHVTFCLSERRPAYPAHAPDMDEDEDEDDTHHLCCQHQGRNLPKKSVTQILRTKISYLWILQDRRQLHQCEEGKDLQYRGTQLLHWSMRHQKTRANEQKIPQL